MPGPVAKFPTLLKGQFISRSQTYQWAHLSITGASIDSPTFIFLLYLEFFRMTVYKTVLFFLLCPSKYHGGNFMELGEEG